MTSGLANRDSRALGGANGEADCLAVLGVAHDLRGDRGLVAERAAKLADDAVGTSIHMDVLARERSAPAVGAAMPVGLEGADTAAKEDALELLDMAYGGHGLKDSPPHPRFLPTRNTPTWPTGEIRLRRLGGG
jgi:hypothetical protein